MTKEVKLRICGMHMHGEDGDRDDVEVISVGQMCERDGFAWITYEEVVEEEENGLVSVVKNLVKYKNRISKFLFYLCNCLFFFSNLLQYLPHKLPDGHRCGSRVL